MSTPGMRLTSDGLDIIRKGLLGQNIHFTKGQLGDGDFDYDSETVVTMTALKSPKLDMPIVGKEINNDGVVLIKTQVINANLQQGFRAKEHGIFALDPDTGNEVLYAYCNVGDEYSFIPGGGGRIHINATKAYLIEISDCENITFNIDWDFAYVSQAEYDNLLAHFIPIWNNFVLPSDEDIDKILAGTYPDTAETIPADGVPTFAEIDAILDGTYTHTDIPVTPFTIDAPTDADIDNILNA